MKAIVFEETGGPDVIAEIEREKPTSQPDEVQIKVKAAGVNRPDVMQRKGLYNPPEGVTDIPGLEVAGEVVQVGSEVKEWNEGDAVCAIVAGGGYAEYVTVHADNVTRLPDGLSFTEGAGLMETFLTVWSHLFKFAKFEEGKSILVHGGASGIGTTAIMLTKVFGASKVFTTVSNREDQRACRQLGADVAINYKTHDFVAEVDEHTAGTGVDFILDIIGGDYVQRNYEAAAMYGTILQVGVMHGKAESLNLFPMLAKRLNHMGITLRSQTVEEKAGLIDGLEKQVWPLIENGDVKPQIHQTFPLTQARQAHEAMEHGGHFGKLVLTV